MNGRVGFLVLSALGLLVCSEAGLIDDIAGRIGGTVDHLRGHVENAVHGVGATINRVIVPGGGAQHSNQWQSQHGVPYPQQQQYNQHQYNQHQYNQHQGHHHGHGEDCHSHEQPGHGYNHHGQQGYGYGRPGQGNPGYGNSGYGNPGYGNPGYGNTGYGNPGNGNYGNNFGNGYGYGQQNGRPNPNQQGQNNFGVRPSGQGTPGDSPFNPGQGNMPGGAQQIPSAIPDKKPSDFGQQNPGIGQGIPTTNPDNPFKDKPQPIPSAIPTQMPGGADIGGEKVETTTVEEFQLDIRGDFNGEETMNVESRFFIDAPDRCADGMKLIGNKCKMVFT